MNYSEHLLEKARAYIAAHKHSDWIFAYAGGSVGRGEADRYSDIDLNIVAACPDQPPVCLNVPYDGSIIQLRIHAWAGSNVIHSLPWRHRFIAESSVVYDPYGAFEKLRPAAIDYYRSKEGRERMLMQSQQEVQKLLQIMDSGIQADELLSASIAAQRAWQAAAASLAWLRHESCASTGLFPMVRAEEPQLFNSFQKIIIGQQRGTDDNLAASLAVYRRFLRDRFDSSFALDPVMDQLAARRAERYAAREEGMHARWLLRSEALWCYIAAGGQLNKFGTHYGYLPEEVQEALCRLGVAAYSPAELSELLHQVERLSELAQQAAGTKICFHEAAR